MQDGERRVVPRHLDGLETTLSGEVGLELLDEGCGRGLREATLLIQQCEEAQGLVHEHAQGGLVVLEADEGGVDALLGILGELEREGVAVEEELQLLVRHVDA